VDDSSSSVVLGENLSDRKEVGRGHNWANHGDSARNFSGVSVGQVGSGGSVAKSHSLSLDVGVGHGLRSHDGPLVRR